MIVIMAMPMSMILSSIDIDVIRTVYYYFFIKMFSHKKTHKLYSNISIHLKSITRNFHLTSITKTSNFHLTSNFHSDAKQ